MVRRRPQRGDGRARLTVLGLGTILVLGAIAYVSYTATSGLPWKSSYDIEVELPSANRLIDAAEVRIGGIRVGQVASVTAVPSQRQRPPLARVALALDPALEELPVDTVARVRPSSVLGATFVELRPGRSRRTIAEGGTLPLRRAAPPVELTDLLDVFDRSTARSFQDTVSGLGDGLAGRGTALNATIGSLSGAMPPLRDVAATLAAPRTRLPSFLREYGSTSGALDSVRGELGGLVSGGAATLDALSGERAALAAAIEAAPPAESAATAAFTRIRPALDGLALLVEELEPASRLLPAALGGVNGTLSAGVRPLRQLPAFSRRLRQALRTLERLSRDRATSGSLRKLVDLADSTNEVLDLLVPAQVQCNVIGLWGQSFGGAFSALGTGRGPSLPALFVTTAGAQGETFQNPSPSPGVGINPIPNVNAHECESGNEPWTGQERVLNNPPGLQSRRTRDTTPPPGVSALARSAGLLDDPEGSR